MNKAEAVEVNDNKCSRCNKKIKADNEYCTKCLKKIQFIDNIYDNALYRGETL